MTNGPLVDGFGRVHSDMRISLTDRCSLRCTYCMPAEGMPWLASSDLLTTDEIVRIASLSLQLGITSFRLTGGEPLVRPDVVEVVARLAQLSGPDGPPELSLTTNGIRLVELAAPLRDAGLSRVNVSLDTLDRERYRTLTRRDKLVETLEGVAAAQAAGLSPIKINAVAMRGVNDDEIVSLTRFAFEHGYQMRFIEQMPLDAGHTWDRQTMVPGAEILEQLGTAFDLTPVGSRGSSPAETWYLDGGPSTVGVIASVTAPFCASCNRVRLTADGQLMACLFAREESDLRTLIRSGADDAALEQAIRANLMLKKRAHGIDDPGFEQPDRGMSAIGG